jgi:nitrogen-specific signal transduction histidine kinase
MKSFRVLLVDTCDNSALTLRRKLLHLSSAKFIVNPTGIKNAELIINDIANQLDLLLINETIPAASILRLVQDFRVRNTVVPIFLLSKISEPGISRKMRNAGVDGVVNSVELETPLSSWTFMSIIEHTMRKRKAREYDVLHNRMKSINESLSNLVHDINNPLSVVRLAVYHLEQMDVNAEKRETFLRLLVNNLDKLDTQLKELTVIRRQLNGGTKKILNTIESSTVSMETGKS